MVTMLHLVALLGAMLCKYTIRDVGFVFLGEPLVTVHDGGIVERSGDGATRLFPSIAPLDGGAFRLALAQDLLDDVAMVLVLPGDDAPRIEAAAQDAVNRLHAMSDQGRLARPLDGPVGVAPFHVTADPIGASAPMPRSQPACPATLPTTHRRDAERSRD